MCFVNPSCISEFRGYHGLITQNKPMSPLIKAHETGNKPDIPYDWIWSDDADPLDNYRGTNETCCTHLRRCDLGSPKRQTADDTQVDYEVPIWVPPIVSPGNCKKTKDEYGRMDANFLGHTGIGHTDNNGLA